MRRGFDWYGLTLPGTAVAGAVALAIGYGLAQDGLVVVGWILLGVAVVAAPLWIWRLVAASRALAAARDVPAPVRFVGAMLREGSSHFVPGPPATVLADDRGLRAVRADGEAWAADWADVAGLAIGDSRVGRFTNPTIDVDVISTGRVRFRYLHARGWPGTYRDAEAVLAQLRRLQARAQRHPLGA